MRVFREIDTGQKSPVQPEEKMPSIEMEGIFSSGCTGREDAFHRDGKPMEGAALYAGRIS